MKTVKARSAEGRTLEARVRAMEAQASALRDAAYAAIRRGDLRSTVRLNALAGDVDAARWELIMSVRWVTQP